MHTDRIWTLLARKLAGESSPEELGELEVLLRENPDMHLKVQAIIESWDDAQADPAEEEALIIYYDLTNKLKEQGHIKAPEEDFIVEGGSVKVSRFFSMRSLITAASVSIIAIAGIFLWLNKKENSKPLAVNPINTISTKNGSRTKVELPDGSVVWLNAGSKLTYDKDFGSSLREVTLVGEGFFDVVHNAARPFVIHTQFFDIKDLGTKFNVKCYPEDKMIETSLVEGSVEITEKRGQRKKWVLKPDEKLVLLNDSVLNMARREIVPIKRNHLPKKAIEGIQNLTYLAQDSFSVETAWTYNKLSFDDEAFSEVAKKMGRWYDREFEFKDRRLEDIHMNGSFINETLEQAMDGLKYINRFNYQIKDRKVTIY